MFPGGRQNGNRDERIAKALLSGTTVHETETKSLAEIARAFRAQAAEVKRGRDPAFGAYLCIVSLLPWRLVRGFLNLGSWLVYGLNLDLGFLGLPSYPFGSVMITNVGGMGIDVAWAPLVPYTRCPLLLALGTIRDKAVVEKSHISNEQEVISSSANPRYAANCKWPLACFRTGVSLKDL